MWYVVVDKIIGRYDYIDLATRLNYRGIEDRVEYSEGGWQDNNLKIVLPHLRFEFEDDALAYVISYGGKVVNDIPVSVSFHKVK